MKLSAKTPCKIIRSISSTHDHEIGCQSCFEQLDKFAELKLAGKKTGQALPLVKDHLKRCQSCRQEFKALLDALKTLGKIYY